MDTSNDTDTRSPSVTRVPDEPAPVTPSQIQSSPSASPETTELAQAIRDIVAAAMADPGTWYKLRGPYAPGSRAHNVRASELRRGMRWSSILGNKPLEYRTYVDEDRHGWVLVRAVPPQDWNVLVEDFNS